ncbi:MAG TPA: hypothetical protein ENF48_01700 [Desulfobacteraceae bacterium]|nr:hypothetical protein [Desulfobacteraceae bacterium]
MAIRRDMAVFLEAAEITAALCRGRPCPPLLARTVETALETARKLLDPVIVDCWVAVAAVGDGRAVVQAEGDRQRILQIGPHARLLAGARQALVAAVSIGSRLDEAAGRKSRLEGYVLDCIGVMALGKVADAAAAKAEAEAGSRQWGVGPRISPGSLAGWPMEDVHVLCGMLPLAEAGLKLSAQGVIDPLKSAVGLIGIGPGYGGSTVGSVCHLCRHREACWRRRG